MALAPLIGVTPASAEIVKIRNDEHATPRFVNSSGGSPLASVRSRVAAPHRALDRKSQLPWTSRRCAELILRPSQRSELYTASRFGSSRDFGHSGSVLSQHLGERSTSR